MVQLRTAPLAMLANACSYVISVITLARISRPEPAPPQQETRRRLGTEIIEGIAFLIRNPYLRTIAVLGSSYNFCFMFIDGIFVLFAVTTLGLSAATIGLVLGLSAVGGLAGAAFTRRYRLGGVYAGAVLIGYCAPLLVPAADGPTWLRIALVGGGFLLLRFGLAVANVLAVSIRQAVTPPQLMARHDRGHANAALRAGNARCSVGGLTAANLGLRNAIWIAAIGSAVATVPLIFSVIPQLTRLPTSPEEALMLAGRPGSAGT